jgi:DNA repair protein RecN (Recombination protein N)
VATGIDRIEFQVSANPGQPLMPLNKVASGGELSRISLAIQVATVQQGGIPTLIFDEVDVGIGGGVAELVGEKLRTIGRTRQVLCVTHQPQVAALGHNQLRVSKQTGDASTLTQIQVLNAEERCDELARMLGGIKITEQTRAHARELMARAQQH